MRKSLLWGPFFLLLWGVFLLLPLSAEQKKERQEGVFEIQIQTHPLKGFHRFDREKRRFGSLEFLGGVVLKSETSAFGQISGILAFEEGERFLAVTDSGFWLHFKAELDSNGVVRSIPSAQMARILDKFSRPLGKKFAADAEGLTQLPAQKEIRVPQLPKEGGFLVSFEGRHRLELWPAPASRAMRHKAIPFLDLRPLVKGKLSNPNKGIEAVAVGPSGTMLAGDLFLIAESGKQAAAAPIPAWRLQGSDRSKFWSFWIAPHNGFEVTDAAFLPNGALLLLERSFTFPQGAKMRLRLVTEEEMATESKKGGLLVGKELLNVGFFLYNIDNMEALSIHRRKKDGALILSLVSDDNYSTWQRTLLLQFRFIP